METAGGEVKTIVSLWIHIWMEEQGLSLMWKPSPLFKVRRAKLLSYSVGGWERKIVMMRKYTGALPLIYDLEINVVSTLDHKRVKIRN